MANYRRNFVPGGTYFFTVVTHQRRPILTDSFAQQCLRQAIQDVRKRHSFNLDAIVLMPDHLHSIWTLPSGDADYPMRWRRIKEIYTRNYLSTGMQEAEISTSRQCQGDRGVWQRRYYEHTVRDEKDLQRCIDYLHLNPVKHKLVSCVRDWPWSSFHRYVKMGEYSNDWGGSPELFGDEWEQFE